MSLASAVIVMPRLKVLHLDLDRNKTVISPNDWDLGRTFLNTILQMKNIIGSYITLDRFLY